MSQIPSPAGPVRPVSRPSLRRIWPTLAALLVTALLLRSPLTAIAPVVGELRAGLGIGQGMAGLLTSIPVLCFGVLSPAASALVARTSVAAGLYMSLAGIVLGLVLRSSGGIGLALAGTLVIGGALTLGNIVSLLVIARDFQARASLATGLYASFINIGTMMTSAVTAPLAAAVGWRVAIAAVAVLAVPSAILWIVANRGRKARSGPAAASARIGTAPAVWRRPLVWLLTLALVTHQFSYYGLTAWLPAYLTEAIAVSAARAGAIASVFQITGLLGAFGVPLVSGRIAPSRLLVGVSLCWAVTAFGLLVRPDAWIVWSVMSGIASGGGFTLIFLLIMRHAVDLDDNRRVSTLVQCVAYSLSSVAPLALGALHEAWSSWTPGFLVLTAAGLAMTGAALAILRAAGRSGA